MTDQALSILVPAVVAFVVALVTHTFTSARDISKQQRDQRISYLISAFRALQKANHHPKLYEVAESVEQAISDIQLLGTPSQIALAKKFSLELGETQSADLKPLLTSLRNSLRKELKEKPVQDDFVALRIFPPRENTKQDTRLNRQR